MMPSRSGSQETRARYYLCARNTQSANAAGLFAGDILAVHDGGTVSIMRHAAYGPPLALRARMEAEGALQPLEPKATH